MKKREKRGAFANRIAVQKKQAKCSQHVQNDAAFLSSYTFTREKCIRKSPPFLDKNRFANNTLFHVYYPSGTAKNNALRSPGKGLFLSLRRKQPPTISSSGEIAEALPRTRGLKYTSLSRFLRRKRHCRGIAPNEGTEMPVIVSVTLIVANCRGIAPNEGTEI